MWQSTTSIAGTSNVFVVAGEMASRQSQAFAFGVEIAMRAVPAKAPLGTTSFQRPLLTVPPDGPRRITAFIATVVCSDVGGYAAGVLFGKHPMAPSVSPKKSWEGFCGSLVACAAAGALFFHFLFHVPWWQGVLYGLCIVASATLGDLGESMVKRDIGIKDMGHLLPGHGGVMDRLDSLLPTAPIAWLLLVGFVG